MINAILVFLIVAPPGPWTRVRVKIYTWEMSHWYRKRFHIETTPTQNTQRSDLQIVFWWQVTSSDQVRMQLAFWNSKWRISLILGREPLSVKPRHCVNMRGIFLHLSRSEIEIASKFATSICITCIFLIMGDDNHSKIRFKAIPSSLGWQRQARLGSPYILFHQDITQLEPKFQVH